MNFRVDSPSKYESTEEKPNGDDPQQAPAFSKIVKQHIAMKKPSSKFHFHL